MTSPVISAPMAFVSGAALAVAVTKAGGLGFIAAGYDIPAVENELREARRMLGVQDTRTLGVGVGVGFIAWGADPDKVLPPILALRPCAIWVFSTVPEDDYTPWVNAVHTLTPPGTTPPKVFAQVGSVTSARKAAEQGVDVIVAQSSDAGGHGGTRGCGLTSLVPEIIDAVHTTHSHIPVYAAGGLVDGRGLASVLALGADGGVFGTRFVATPEALPPRELKEVLVRASDGGQCTTRTRVFDDMRGTTGWPMSFDGRALRNKTTIDGVTEAENKKLYKEALHKKDYERLVVWAGTGVGLVKEIKPAGEVVREIWTDCGKTIKGLKARI
ncbi:inosine monophosphate dehydrogenase [Saitoella complicata NRRL Y-17804]|nr:inosine monophosphate dehydrogenase [Saitoella complicata NRRL Y-17804]ODQ55292.1 inosine monophosphate dehydrogenase [Saitoella complicata NRRL Y-17804]